MKMRIAAHCAAVVLLVSAMSLKILGDVSLGETYGLSTVLLLSSLLLEVFALSA